MARICLWLVATLFFSVSFCQSVRMSRGHEFVVPKRLQADRKVPRLFSEFRTGVVLPSRFAQSDGIVRSGGNLCEDGPAAQAATLLRNWETLGFNGFHPADVGCAAGPSHVIVTTNDDWAIYNKHRDLIATHDFNDWLGSADLFFAPVCAYDAFAGRFLICVLQLDAATKQSSWVLLVSASSDPRGTWWSYTLDARLDGATPTNNFADAPSLGFDSNAIYLTADMFDFDSLAFVKAKTRILKKSDVYAHAGATWFDLYDFLDDGVSVKSRSLRAAVSQTASSQGYLLNAVNSGGNYLVQWTISDPTTSPTVASRKIGVAPYSVPPPARQLGSAQQIATGDCRLQNAAYAAGALVTAHNAEYVYTSTTNSVLNYYRVDAATGAVDWDQTFGSSGSDYYHPAVATNSVGDLAVIFARSGDAEYIGLRHTGRRVGGPTQGSSSLRLGDGAFSAGDRWGDYFGACVDPVDGKTFWMVGQFAKMGNTWGTYLGEASFERSPDATKPGNWQDLTPTQTTDTTPDVTIKAQDTDSGLYPPTAQYRLSKDGGVNWSAWQAATCTGSDATTALQTLKAASVPYFQDSMNLNRIQFQIEDMFGNTGTSGTYIVPVDSTSPQDWQGFAPTDIVNGGLQLCSAQVRDLTSGLGVTTAEFRYTIDAGAHWTAWAPAACSGADGSKAFETVSALVPFNHHSLLGEDCAQFRIRDAFGNLGTAAAFAVFVDGVSLVTGTVQLANYVGARAGLPLTLWLYEGQTLVETVETTLDAAGKYSVYFKETGGTLLRAKVSHWLSASQAATLNGSSANGFDWTFAYNGDGDGSNQLDLVDINAVLVNFASPGPGDYNGDGSADVNDFVLVLVDWGQVGT